MTTSVSISLSPILQFFNNQGQPNAGGSVLTQVGGVNYATYQDSAGSIPLPNPIPLNNRGEVSNSSGVSSQLFLVNGAAYTFTLFDPMGNQINEATYVVANQSATAELEDDLAATSAPDGASLIGHSGIPSYGANGVATLDEAVLNKLYPQAVTGTDTRGVDLHFITNKGSLRYGGSDTTSLDDARNYWRGLPGGGTANAWGDPAIIGVYSTAFNRNGASYAPYSNTFGHDCVVYGVAGTAGGAGSCAGNPDAPTAAAGYCSFAYGRNVIALGEKSAALCEESAANGRASFAAGWFATTGLNGVGAIALGYNVKAGVTTGVDGTTAIGFQLNSNNGAMLFGRGINDGNPLINTAANSIGFGSNVSRPTIEIMPGVGDTTDSGYPVFRGKQQYYGATTFLQSETVQEQSNSGSGGYGNYCFRVMKAGVMTDACNIDAGQTGGIISFFPKVDVGMRLGSAAERWEVLFAATGTINTSDETLKQQIKPIDAAALRAWAKVEYCQFKFNDAVAEKGDGARWHFGVIAQRVQAAFASEGLDAMQYGLLCLDKWTDKEGVAQQRYGVRYEEALVLECAYLRSRLA